MAGIKGFSQECHNPLIHKIFSDCSSAFSCGIKPLLLMIVVGDIRTSRKYNVDFLTFQNPFLIRLISMAKTKPYE